MFSNFLVEMLLKNLNIKYGTNWVDVLAIVPLLGQFSLSVGILKNQMHEKKH